MKSEKSILPVVLIFAISVLAFVIPTLFLRQTTGWMILLFLAPFGALQLFAIWLFTRDLTDRSQGEEGGHPHAS